MISINYVPGQLCDISLHGGIGGRHVSGIALSTIGAVGFIRGCHIYKMLT